MAIEKIYNGERGISVRTKINNLIDLISIPTKYRFVGTNARDLYFTTHPDELVDGVRVLVQDGDDYQLFEYVLANTEWLEITDIIVGPAGEDGAKGDKGDKGDPADGSEIINDEVISAEKTYSSEKIESKLSEDGFKDNGLYSQFEDSFKNLPKGMSYIYGYSEETGLPVLSNDNPIFVSFGEFAGYDYNVFCLLGSHDDDEGLWAYIENAGTEGKWFKLGCPDDADKLDAITDTGSGKIITDEERQMLGDFAFTDQIMKDNGIIRNIDASFKDVIEKGVTTLLGGWDDVSQLPDLEVKEASVVSFGVIGGGGNRLYILCNNHDGYFLFSKDGGYQRDWSKIVESRFDDAIGTSPRKTGDYNYQWTKEAMFSIEDPENLAFQQVVDSGISGLNLKPSQYVKTVETPIGSVLVLETKEMEEAISGKYSVGEELTMSGKTITDLGDCVNPKDGVNKQVMEGAIDNSFKTANSAALDAEQYMVDLRDLTRGAGYGSSTNQITYEGVGNDTLVQPNKSLGLLWFIHEKVNSTVGFLQVHESLLGDLVSSGVNIIPCIFTGLKAALGKSNQVSTVLLDENARWNCTGGAIQVMDDANTLPPPNSYYNKQGEPGMELDRANAFSGTYSFGSSAIVGARELRRGYVKNIDDFSARIEDNENSEFFVIKVTGGGGTFNVKKVFQYFPKEYERTVYSTTEFSIAFGLKVTDNRERIFALEEESEDVTPVEQPEDENGVIETINLKAKIKSSFSLTTNSSITKVLGYSADQVNVVTLGIILSANTTDSNNAFFGKVNHIEGTVFKKDGAFNFLKRSSSGDNISADVSVNLMGNEIQVVLSNATCDLKISTEASVIR